MNRLLQESLVPIELGANDILRRATDHHDLGQSLRRMGSKRPTNSAAVHVRHHEVDQKQVRDMEQDEVEGEPAIRRPVRSMASSLKQHHCQVDLIALVVDDDDVLRDCRRQDAVFGGNGRLRGVLQDPLDVLMSLDDLIQRGRLYGKQGWPCGGHRGLNTLRRRRKVELFGDHDRHRQYACPLNQ